MTGTLTSGHVDHVADTTCPHCRTEFSSVLDLQQPPRLQGVKCPNCKLFVPARHVATHAGDE